MHKKEKKYFFVGILWLDLTLTENGSDNRTAVLTHYMKQAPFNFKKGASIG